MCRLGNEAHQKRLLSEPDLTLDKALMLAQSLETADVNAKTLRGHEPALRWLSQGSSHQHSASSQGRLGHHLRSGAESVIVVAVGII